MRNKVKYMYNNIYLVHKKPINAHKIVFKTIISYKYYRNSSLYEIFT